MNKLDFLPIILGSDDNGYGIARAIYEEYQIKSIVVTKGNILPTMHSKIIEKEYIDSLDQDETFVENMTAVWQKYKDKANKLILIGCNENYAELCIRHKISLLPMFLIPYINEDLMENIIYKEQFYQMCEEHGLDYPKTSIITKESNTAITLPFDFPVVLKPSDTVTYFNAQFPGKEKAYIIHDQQTLEDTIKLIYQSTYSDTLIIQEYIPGKDDSMRVINAYVDKNHKVRLIALGQIVLEDCTPILLGNYVAITADYDKDLYDKYVDFLESIEFTGFANIDLKYDERDGKYKIFELNIRQGRSSFFVTASGFNLMKYMIDDLVYDNQNDTVYANGEILWHSIPKSIIKKYVTNENLKDKVNDLIKRKKTSTTLFYNKDFSPIRYLKLYNFYRDYHQRFKKYFNN